MKLESILVPTDFSDHAEEAFRTAIELAKTFGAQIELIHAYDFGHWVDLYQVTFAEELAAGIREAANRQLREWAARGEAAGVEVSVRLAMGPPSRVIAERAEEAHVDLVVMGTQGRSALSHVLLGSVAERIVRGVACPVWTTSASRRERSDAR